MSADTSSNSTRFIPLLSDWYQAGEFAWVLLWFFLSHQLLSADLCTDKVDLLLRGRVCVAGSLGGSCCQLFPLISLRIFLCRSCSLGDAQQDHSILGYSGISFWQFNEIFKCYDRSYWACACPFNSSIVCERVTHGSASSYVWVLVEAVETMIIY